jgi:hypothetical protein
LFYAHTDLQIDVLYGLFMAKNRTFDIPIAEMDLKPLEAPFEFGYSRMTAGGVQCKLGESVVLAALALPGTLLAPAERPIDSGGIWTSPNRGCLP